MVAFIHQVTSGIAGWLTFEQMRKGTDNLREAELAKPIELIARGRGFEVEGEFPLPSNGKKGGPRRLDFLMVKRSLKLVIALEIKYKKADRRMAGSLGADAARLDGLSIDMINSQISVGKGGAINQGVSGFTLQRAVLVVWHQTGIMQQLRYEPTVIKEQFIRLVKNTLPADTEPTARNYSEAMLGKIATKPVARAYGSLRAGSTVTNKRFWVASFLHQSSWKKIARS